MTQGVNATALTTVTVAGHGYTTGNNVIITGVTGSGFSPTINATRTLTVTGPNTFTVPVTCTTISANFSNATATVSGISKPITGLSGLSTVYVNNHGLATGQTTNISGVTGGSFSPAINGTHTVTNNGDPNSFLVSVTRLSNTGQSVSGARVSIPDVYPDIFLKQRIREIVHLIVTSPDFTIQK
jgi:hypothetical protein